MKVIIQTTVIEIMPTSKTISKSASRTSQPKKSRSELAQASRFGLVGIINTVIDFVIATIISSAIGATTIYAAFATPEGNFTITGVIIASVVAGFIAMINSYFLNLRFTFKAHAGGLNQAIKFFAITGFGLGVLRPLVIKLTTDWWAWPVDFGYAMSQVLHLGLSRDIIITLIGVASAIVIIWPYNYLMYKKFVFTNANKKEQA